MNFGLADRVVVITGAGSGIGLATCLAFTFESRRALRVALDRCREAGLRPDSPPITLAGLGSVVYVNHEDGVSIELLSVAPRARRFLGFEPGRTPRLAPFLSRTGGAS